MIDPTIDPELAGMDSGEISQRNERIWRAVRDFCLATVGLDPVRKHTRKGSGVAARTATRACVAALRICRARYGIPPSRLAELSGCQRSWVSIVTRGDPDLAVAAIVAGWDPATLGGTDTVYVEITRDAADALSAVAACDGCSPVALASAAVLACAELFRNPKQSA